MQNIDSLLKNLHVSTYESSTNTQGTWKQYLGLCECKL